MKKYIMLQIVILIVGCVICCFFSIPAGMLLLVTGMLLLLIQYGQNRKQNQNIMKLCDKITRILNGADTVQFNEFQEGEFSILSSEIHKMTIRLREQNTALSREKQFMKEALEDMSHQLRTPLTSMMLITGMLRRQELSPRERSRQIQELMKLLSQMQWQIETLL
ncbi:MAG: sensor histidine kinase, partial [Ruminococcus sp.]|nr:sensor histidine kinase [Ruminococcus sp.]